MYALIVSLSMLACFLLCVTAAGPGAGTECCKLALQAFHSSIGHDGFKCGQQYKEGFSAALEFLVPTSWCRQHCGGYTLSPASDTNVWASPLVQYILPAVIFCMTIPRGQVLEPPKWFFDFHLNHLNSWLKATFSLCVAGVIVTFDTVIWVFMIMIAPGPFIFSGLWSLNTSHTARGQNHPEGLDRSERVQLLTAVVAGNLSIEGVPADPQKELGEILDIHQQPEEVEVRLRAMLACQYPFGAAVGAPILLYIGSFVHSLVTLHNAEGDKDTARALAFGIWWMNIVHVAAISGCLLASNNPSTAAGFVKKRRIRVSYEDRVSYANDLHEMEDKIQARVENWSRLPLIYKARYEPVWMWTRGKSKAGWLRRTEGWQKPWFRKNIEVTVQGWIFLTAIAYLLIFLPCALAFWIEYTTPAIGVGCRGLTILVYAGAQFVFVVLSAWSHFKVAHSQEYWDGHTWLNRLRRPVVGTVVAMLLLLPAWISAMFTTFAGTLMQISGIYQNCLCASTGYWIFPSSATVSLATDTESDRQSSWHWKRAGYTALIFLACVTYLGWWCQRYLREKFIERVEHLVPVESDEQADNSRGNKEGEIDGRETKHLELDFTANPQESESSSVRYSGFSGSNDVPLPTMGLPKIDLYPV